MSKTAFIGAVATTLFGPVPAAAQSSFMADVIGQAVANSSAQAQMAQCVGGTTSLSEKEAREADEPVEALMAKYWATVSASENAMIDGFYHPFGKAIWASGGSEIRARTPKGITDPYARGAGNVLVEKPVVIVRGRSGQNARGIWEVRSSAGGHVGYYLADFLRSPNWRLLRLELLPAEAPAPEVRPFCAEPGDIDAFHKAAEAIPESRIVKITSKSTQVITCAQGSDCAQKWTRARRWVQDNGRFPLIRDTDTVLLTAGPIYADTTPAYVIVLDPPSADGRQIMRFRAWCGNMFGCFPSPTKAREALLADLQQGSTVSGPTTK